MLVPRSVKTAPTLRKKSPDAGYEGRTDSIEQTRHWLMQMKQATVENNVFLPPLLSPLNRWSASSPATAPFKTSRSPRWSATPSPSSGREITKATIIKFDAQLHSCSESGVLWIEANLIGY